MLQSLKGLTVETHLHQLLTEFLLESNRQIKLDLTK